MTRTSRPASRAVSSVRSSLLLLLAPALACAVLWLAVDASSFRVTDPGHRAGLVSAAGWLAAAAVLAGVVLGWRRPVLLPGYVVATAATLAPAVAVVALHGTVWGFKALGSDSGFRTQAVTRYADSPALGDYGYADLPAYYPPAWPWLQGRTAALLDVPGWTVVKPAAVVLAVLVPVVAFLLWRRVAGPLPAAFVVLATTAATAHLQKPDEWLVLAWLVPWWLEVVRGVRAEGVAPRPRWVDGLLLGGLLLTHTYFFLPLAVATILGWLADLALRRRAPLGMRDMAVIGAVGLLVASPYWAPVLVARLVHEQADTLQLRWSPRGTEIPPLPFDDRWWGVLAAVAVGWLVHRGVVTARARDATCRPTGAGLALGLGLALAGGYLVATVGQWLQRFEVAMLAHKSHELLVALLVAGGVLALVELLRWTGTRVRGPVVVIAATAVALGMSVPAARHVTDRWTAAGQAGVAHTMRYPDGTFPEGRPADAAAVAFGTRRSDPSVEEVRRTWRELSGRGPEDDSSTVLVTNRVDLLATTPVHSFTAWKSIYSHPLGRYEERVALLQEVARCPTPECAARLLRTNPYDPVDGLVASREGEELVLVMGVDNFPEGWSRLDLRIPLRVLAGEQFRRADVGNVTVVEVTDAG